MKPLLVTSALPYANGPLHLGHILENVYADIWVRFWRLQGREVYFFCADDTHGTPIMLEARKRNQSPEDLIKQVSKDHVTDFRSFSISFDHYSSTHSETNRQICYEIYKKIKSQGDLEKRIQAQMYCEHDKMFLPDRFIRGTCPYCQAPQQYGDGCEICGASYRPDQLLQPQCGICGNPPVAKEAEQIFFRLDRYRNFLKEILPQITQSEVVKKMGEWLIHPLRDWDISRQAPYFGFPVPEEKDLYFYVWLDAPVGYISTSQEYFGKENPEKWQDFWKHDLSTEVVHFIGKDITYFHVLFWPAVLKASQFRVPTQVVVHSFMKVNGQKMSKSKGNFILAKNIHQSVHTDFIRFYIGGKLTRTLDDMDFNLSEFVQKSNAELIGKIINIYSRSWNLLKNFELKTKPVPSKSREWLEHLERKYEEPVKKNFADLNFQVAMNLIRELASEINRYFDDQAPWKTVRLEPNLAHEALSTTVHASRMLATFLLPVIPNTMEKVFRLLGDSPTEWKPLKAIGEVNSLHPYQNLLNRIDEKQIGSLVGTDTNISQNQ